MMIDFGDDDEPMLGAPPPVPEGGSFIKRNTMSSFLSSTPRTSFNLPPIVPSIMALDDNLSFEHPGILTFIFNYSRYSLSYLSFAYYRESRGT